MTTKPNMGVRIDASDLALMLGITRQHLTRLSRAGHVPGAYRTKGGHWRYRWNESLAATAHAYLDKYGPLTRTLHERGGRSLPLASGLGSNLTQTEIGLKVIDIHDDSDAIDEAIKVLRRRKAALHRAGSAILRAARS